MCTSSPKDHIKRLIPKLRFVTSSRDKGGLLSVTKSEKVMLYTIYSVINTIILSMEYGTKPKIVNIVSTGQVNAKLNLPNVALKIDAKNVEYEPETYPGLLLKLNENGAHVTLYSNGKYIILGQSTVDGINKTHEILIDKLKEIGVFEE